MSYVVNVGKQTHVVYGEVTTHWKGRVKFRLVAPKGTLFKCELNSTLTTTSFEIQHQASTPDTRSMEMADPQEGMVKMS